MDRIPCRASQDISRHHAALDRAELDQPEFDCFLDEDYAEVLGKDLARHLREPLQALLVAGACGIENVAPSMVAKMIRDIDEAMKEAFKESL